MATYELGRLQKEESTGKIFIEVISIIGDRKYPIMKWLSPLEPTHENEVQLCNLNLSGELAGVEKQKFNNIVKSLHEENIRALVGSGHLDKTTKLPIQ
jgi:hypothetical protein